MNTGIYMPPSGGGSGHTHPNLLSLNRLGVSSAGKLTIDSVEFTQNAWKDPVNLVGDLPASGNTVGDTRLVTSDNTVYAWTDEGTWARIAASGVQTVSAGSSALVVTSADPLNPVVDMSQASKDSLTHTNRTTLDKLGETGGTLTFNGVAVGGGGSSSFIGCRVFSSVDIPTANATATLLTFNQESYDTNNIHSTTVDTSKFVIPVSGYYRAKVTIRFAANAAGYRIIRAFKNGNAIAFASATFFSTSTTFQHDYTLDFVERFTVGDYIEFKAQQNSGTTLNVTTSTLNTNVYDSPTAEIYFLGP